MKKLIVLLIFLMFTVGCGDPKTIDGYTYGTYGFLNKSENRNPNIEYEFIFGNLAWSIILSETIVMPIYFFGFSIYEPIGLKDPSLPSGALR